MEKPQEPHLAFNSLNLRRADHFGKLYDYFAPRIYRHALIRTNSSEEARDVTSKTFLKTWEYLKAGHKIKNIRAFLYRAADNLIIDWYRTRTPVLALSKVGLPEEDIEVADPHDVESEITEQFDVGLVKDMLPLLRPQEQAIIVMRFIDDMTIEEIAEALEKSRGAVAVSIHRALHNLIHLCKERYGTLA